MTFEVPTFKAATYLCSPLYILETISSLKKIKPTETMSDPEVATKAPESDQTESLVQGDTPAQEGASMGVCTPFYFDTVYSNVNRSIV